MLDTATVARVCMAGSRCLAVVVSLSVLWWCIFGAILSAVSLAGGCALNYSIHFAVIALLFSHRILRRLVSLSLLYYS